MPFLPNLLKLNLYQSIAFKYFKFWSGKRDSNSRPIPWQGIALPAELFPRREASILAIFGLVSRLNAAIYLI